MGGGPPGFPLDSTGPEVLGNLAREERWPFAYGAVTLYGRPSPCRSARPRFCNFLRGPEPSPARPHYPTPATPLGLAPTRFRLFPFRSPLLGEWMSLSFPPATEMVHFAGSRLTRVLGKTFPMVMTAEAAGFPHSGIPGSKRACRSPGLIAACHALHRLPVPRHPPEALSTFLIPLNQTKLLVKDQKLKTTFLSKVHIITDLPRPIKWLCPLIRWAFNHS